MSGVLSKLYGTSRVVPLCFEMAAGDPSVFQSQVTLWWRFQTVSSHSLPVWWYMRRLGWDTSAMCMRRWRVRLPSTIRPNIRWLLEIHCRKFICLILRPETWLYLVQIRTTAYVSGKLGKNEVCERMHDRLWSMESS